MNVPRMPSLPDRIALVQDALPCFGGAERVLERVAGMFTDAPIHTLVHRPSAFAGTGLADREVHTSFIDRLPGAHRNHRRFLPLMPMAIERFDLTSFDLVLSLNYAVAHGVLTRPGQLHISYTYTPLRQAWQGHHGFLRSLPAPKRWVARPILHYLRLWDRAAASRVDRFVAISRWISECIWRAYRRRAPVIYPPVDVNAFTPDRSRDDYYLAISRLEPHKRIDLVVKAFAGTRRRLVVVGDGSLRGRLSDDATSNVEFLGRVTDAEVAELLSRARALVHAAEEDFGIALVEAQAAGCPVVAYAGGGAGEIVVPGRTGVLFDEQTPDGVRRAVDALEALPGLPVGELRSNAQRFSAERFERELSDLLEREWAAFRTRGSSPGTDRPEGLEAAG